MPNLLKHAQYCFYTFTDDLGWTDLEMLRKSFNEIPHIDKLAERGIRFTQAYAACPVCSTHAGFHFNWKVSARLHLTNFL